MRAGNPRPRRASDSSDGLRIGGVKQHAGVAASRAIKRAEQRAYPRPEVGRRRIGVGERTGRAHGGAGAATHAQMRLDGDVIAVRANGERRAHVDALRAADLFRAAVRADRRLVREEFRLLEFADDQRELRGGLRLLERIGARREIALRRLMLREPARRRQIQHGIEAPGARRIPASEIDGADGAARGDARAMILAAVEVDLEVPADRVLGTGDDAGVAARAQVEIDRVVLRPLGVERAEPAGKTRQPPGKYGDFARTRQLGAVRRAGGEHRDRQCRPQQVRPAQRFVEPADDQHLSFGLVRDARYGLGIGQRGHREQGRNLRRCLRRLGRPPGGFADVHEADRTHAGGLFRHLAQQPPLLRARDDHVAAGLVLEAGELALAHRGVHRRQGAASARARDRGSIERHRAVARAKENVLVGEGHRRVSASFPR